MQTKSSDIEAFMGDAGAQQRQIMQLQNQLRLLQQGASGINLGAFSALLNIQQQSKQGKPGVQDQLDQERLRQHHSGFLSFLVP